MGDGVGDGARYRAFISYSHVDKAFGRRLHRRLERYALPRRLVGRLTPSGPAPARVAPVFRDRDELPAAGDLTAEVRAALAASGALVVVCSPAAAASPWVAREIDLFRELHPDRPVLAALIAGEPAAAFPPALTRIGELPVEPLAADFRREGDGPRLALLKLVAGVLGLGLDELVQRDVQRRLRGVTAVTAGAAGLVLVMSGLTTYALVQRAEAQRQRGEAEALVEFMLTDLRDRLKGVGRLDVLTAVNDRALSYYAEQEAERLPPESLERRARILHAMGEDDLERGSLDAAARKLEAAEHLTAELLKSAPGNPDRIWSHAQSLHWLAYASFRAGRRSDAKNGWSAYRTLAAQLVALQPKNPTYLRELGYAEGNLCTVALSCPADAASALKSCRAALFWMNEAAARSEAPDALARDLANRHAWLSQAYIAEGDLTAAMAERDREEAVLAPLVKADPNAMDIRSQWVALQRAKAGLESVSGRPMLATRRLLETQAIVDQMIRFEPSNRRWATLRIRIDETLSRISTNKQADGVGACR